MYTFSPQKMIMWVLVVGNLYGGLLICYLSLSNCVAWYQSRLLLRFLITTTEFYHPENFISCGYHGLNLQFLIMV